MNKHHFKNNFTMIWGEAFFSLLKNKTRSFLTMLAVSIGIAAVIVVFSAGDGLDYLLRSQLEIFGTDIIEVEVKVPNVGKTSSENAQGMAQGITITTFKNSDIEAIKKHKNIVAGYGATMSQEAVRYENKLKKFFFMGVSAEAPEVDNTEVAEGRFFTEEEDGSLAPVAVLGHEAAKELFEDQDPINKIIDVKGKKFRVVGVMEERGSVFFMNMDDMIYVPLRTLQKRILGIDYVSFAVFKLKDTSLAKETQVELTEIMRDEHDITDPNKDDFAVNTMDEAQEMFDSIIGSTTLLLVAIVCISLLVGGVGIMNIMYVSVAERTFEIGLRKALGARRANILWQFLSESVVITFLGGIMGVIWGALAALLVYLLATGSGLEWIYSVSPFSIFLSVGFSIVVGIIFGLYPARKAANLDPIAALRKE